MGENEVCCASFGCLLLDCVRLQSEVVDCVLTEQRARSSNVNALGIESWSVILSCMEGQ